MVRGGSARALVPAGRGPPGARHTRGRVGDRPRAAEGARAYRQERLRGPPAELGDPRHLRAQAAGARTFPELGAPRAYSGDTRRATPQTGERLYAALGEFVAQEAASLLR